MIKQIWFVRNITRLFVSLSFTINLVISLYAFLSALALTQVLNNENLIIAMLQQYNGLLFFPFLGWCFFVFFFGLSLYLKRARKKFITQKSLCLQKTLYTNETQKNEDKEKLSNAEEMRLLFLTHFITSSNFSCSIIFAFFSLDVISMAKNIQSFGIFPVILCIIATIYYYITLILKLFKKSTIIT